MTLELLTASRLRTFRDCARKHHLSYVEGYKPVQTPDALRFGQLIHVGLEQYWKAILANQTSVLPTCVPLDCALAGIDGFTESDAFEMARAKAMLRAYAERWASDPQEYDVFGVEVEFRAPLLNPATNLSKSRTWQLGGKIDAILHRRSDKRVLICEHKGTVESIDDASDYWPKLAIDYQVSGYVVGAEALGYHVDEILYDVLAKPAQRPLRATPPESRKYKADGTLYANQRAVDETPDEYGARVTAALAERPDKGCVRKAIPRTESQIRDFLYDAWQQGRTMREMELEGFAPRNPEACDRFGRCPYWSVCSTGTHPSESPSEFMQVTNRNPELTENA